MNGAGSGAARSGAAGSGAEIADAEVFDICGLLPSGTTVLQASAGTGKTSTIAGLIARYLGEGAVRVEELLVVTFSRAATGELRTRVRQRLMSTRDGLLDPDSTAAQADPVVQLLASGPPAEVARRRARIVAALTSFDAATVATVHQFCQQVLLTLGIAAEVDPTATLVENLDTVLAEVCDDLYLRFADHAGRHGSASMPFDRGTALRVAAQAISHPDALLGPLRRVPDTPADLRVRFAAAARAEFGRRKSLRRVVSFDDLLLLLRDALIAPGSAQVACERLRRRYHAVLVDEFQDTDAVQWDILRSAFHGHRPLVLIGDPKQAIYTFRGADVRSYLAAAALATERWTLDTNLRSDASVVAGVGSLLRAAVLGEAGIQVSPVRAVHPEPALAPADPQPVRIRLIPRQGLPRDSQGLPLVAPARQAVAEDVGAQVAEVLAETLTVVPRSGPARPLAAADIAVLVRTRAQGDLVQAALQRRGVPCVLARGDSVYATPAAREWAVLLEALEQPNRTQRIRRLAISVFIGNGAAELAAAGESATDRLAQRLQQWGAVLTERGVAGLFARVTEDGRLAARLLQLRGGERMLTDLRHVAESLADEAATSHLGITGLLSWLRARIEESRGDLDQNRSRRLDTDRAAVQIATVHASKGLEFAVVCVPFGWDEAGGGPRDRLPYAQLAEGRVLHVGGKNSPGYQETCAAQDAEAAGDELRLLYVALTRAVSRLLVWWAPSRGTKGAPLHRLLFAPDVTAMPATVPVPDDDSALARVETLAAAGVGLHVSAVDNPEVVGPVSTGAVETGQLQAARFSRDIDRLWRRTSYSGLTRGVHEAGQQNSRVSSEPDDDLTGRMKDDETDAEDSAGRTADIAAPVTDDGLPSWREIPSPMADLPSGADFGTLVHAILEEFDPAVAEPGRALTELASGSVGIAPVDAQQLATGLLAAISTPLGPLAGGARLLDIPAADRLPELDFELPLAGGEQQISHPARLRDIAGVLRRHLPAEDPVAAYADQLTEPTLGAQTLAGYLTGSIDAVIRVRSGSPRYLVVDYKTNRLAAPGEPLTAWHYRRTALDEAVRAAHYPLQALLYCVALHRFLRWRQPAYNPDVHLGGVLYLFLRGMCADAVVVPAGQPPPGVWSWRPPADLVVDLSDLLAGGPQ